MFSRRALATGSQELLASVNVTAKGADGRIPFVQACKYGRQRMVEFMLKHDKKQVRNGVGGWLLAGQLLFAATCCW